MLIDMNEIEERLSYQGCFDFICLRTSKSLSVGKFDKYIFVHIFRVSFHAFALCLLSLSLVLVLSWFIC